MDRRLNEIAALANNLAYEGKDPHAYINGAPHIKHGALRHLYGQLVIEVFDASRRFAPTPKVLDLGAGEGSVTLPFLELGARVVAVDISSRQLDVLKSKCARFGDLLETRCEDIEETLSREGEKYDIIAANSFLHHVPDYLTLIDQSTQALTPSGQFFSFQDPLRYDSIGRLTRLFSDAAYVSWRVSKGRNGDLIGGFKRRLRRRRGIYLPDSRHDNAEYHMTRNGVDQDAIREYFESSGFNCRIIRYFATQSRVFQPVGAALGVKNTFAVIAQRKSTGDV
ncbi:MAG TPA: class I SAM-dependent methyltransferase [Lacipirellulaceae bacterium]|nr:class I SAM-dependent methyltransferase [Lacipirellulaceae bacterium]HMP08661.1 class I SAM-dependent methyltransferase [Lacipirellulaceae bacterium]